MRVRSCYDNGKQMHMTIKHQKGVYSLALQKPRSCRNGHMTAAPGHKFCMLEGLGSHHFLGICEQLVFSSELTKYRTLPMTLCLNSKLEGIQDIEFWGWHIPEKTSAFSLVHVGTGRDYAEYWTTWPTTGSLILVPVVSSYLSRKKHTFPARRKSSSILFLFPGRYIQQAYQ